MAPQNPQDKALQYLPASFSEGKNPSDQAEFFQAKDAAAEAMDQEKLTVSTPMAQKGAALDSGFLLQAKASPAANSANTEKQSGSVNIRSPRSSGVSSIKSALSVYADTSETASTDTDSRLLGTTRGTPDGKRLVPGVGWVKSQPGDLRDTLGIKPTNKGIPRKEIAYHWKTSGEGQG